LSGNPADHFVHRHTHRVVRGSLVVCGRPDGRLSALSTAEAAVCLSVCQASSIQSLGGTCESITIGHNPFKLALTSKAVFLKRNRLRFLCERMMLEMDVKEENDQDAALSKEPSITYQNFRLSTLGSALVSWFRRHSIEMLDLSNSRHHDSSVRPRVHKTRSAAALLGAYLDFEESTYPGSEGFDESLSVSDVVSRAILEHKWTDPTRKMFQALDLDNNGFISEEEFIKGSYKLKPGLTDETARALFKEADGDESGHLDYDDFLKLLHISYLETGLYFPPGNRNAKGIVQIEASKEKYFGEILRKYNTGKSEKDIDIMLARSQHFVQELYETRIASLQRFVAMTVMFHQMGSRVQAFFPRISFGFLGYRMDRTHSIMRIATTASPISGSDVRERMRQLQLLKKVQHSILVISMAFLNYKARKEKEWFKELERKASRSETKKPINELGQKNSRLMEQ
jgi:hypothetical protein